MHDGSDFRVHVWRSMREAGFRREGRPDAAIHRTAELDRSGTQKATESVGRAQAFRNMAKEMNCQVPGLFYTMGQYDLAARIEAPDDETVSALLLKVGQLGNVRSTTMRAFTEDQFSNIVKKSHWLS